MRKPIDFSECKLIFNEEKDYTVEDVLEEFFIKFVNQKLEEKPQ